MRSPCIRTGLVIAAVLAIISVAPPARAGLELSLSWSQNAVVDTLVVSEAGTYDCYILVGPDDWPTTFGWLWSPIIPTDGLTFAGVEGLLGPGGTITSEVDPTGLFTVSIDYRTVCVPYDSLLAFAKISVEIDPSALPPDGTGFLWPVYVPGASGNTLLTTGSDHCFWFTAEWPCATAFVRSATVPNANMSFGEVKALYR